MACIGYPFVFIRLVAVVLTIISASVAAAATGTPPAHGASASTPNACAGAAMATNAVVRFYLAVDTRQFAAAYACFSPDEQARLPYTTFVQGYAHTVASHLALADSGVPNGTPVDHVSIDLQAVDAVNGSLVARTFLGQWYVSSTAQLVDGRIYQASAQTVQAVPGLDVARLLTGAGQQILAHVRADVSGDGVKDDLYVTSGSGCASCHAQQVWIYSRGRLVFQQRADDSEIRVARGGAGFELRTDTPNSPGLDSCCPSERTYEEWTWTRYGFTLAGQRIVHVKQTH